MRKWSAIILCFIFLTSTKLSFAQNPFDIIFGETEPEYTASEELDQTLLDQTVSITMFGEGLGFCSGTIIKEESDKHYVLTAKHCIDVTEEMYVENTPVLYIIVSSTDDLALIITDGKIPDKKVAKISYRNLYLNETMHHVAYPSGVIYKASGKLQKITNDWQFFNFKAIPGCSGGGIFNSQGYLSGVVWGGYSNASDKLPLKSVGEGLSDIKVFLKLVGQNINKIF